MNIALFGAPGAGKGTQSATLVEKLGMKHISTGDLFRSAIKNSTDLGVQAKSFMDAGNLVPDSIVIGMVEEVFLNLDGRDFILDGFPRTVPQADALEQILEKNDLKLEKVLFLEVPKDVLIKRLTGRRVCKACGAVNHIESMPTQAEGVCDSCGGESVQRVDDQEESIANRLNVYEESTMPLKTYFSKKEKLVEVDGVGTSEQVYDRVLTAMGGN